MINQAQTLGHEIISLISALSAHILLILIIIKGNNLLPTIKNGWVGAEMYGSRQIYLKTRHSNRKKPVIIITNINMVCYQDLISVPMRTNINSFKNIKSRIYTKASTWKPSGILHSSMYVGSGKGNLTASKLVPTSNRLLSLPNPLHHTTCTPFGLRMPPAISSKVVFTTMSV